MKKMNKKGFTLVELAIVMAVIAILAAVLIPTFASAVEKANKSSAMQAAKNEYELYLAENAEKLTGTENFVIESGKYWFEVKEGQFDATALETAPTYSGKVDLSANVIKSVKTGSSAPSQAPVSGVTNYYTSEANALTNTTAVTASWTASTEYFYVASITDLGSTDVAIYTK